MNTDVKGLIEDIKNHITKLHDNPLVQGSWFYQFRKYTDVCRVISQLQHCSFCVEDLYTFFKYICMLNFEPLFGPSFGLGVTVVTI